MRYRFDDGVLDTTRYELVRGGELVHVEPQVFDVLAHLIEHRDRVVAKAELLDVVWGHQFVSESALTTRIKQLRQAVGDSGRDQRIVRTVHGRGYRFVAPVDELADATEPVKLAIPSDLRQEIRFCRTYDGTRLAYAIVGSGPPLVRAAHWITHLDYDWESPVWRHWLVGLARQRMLVRYDERGCGLSDHDVDDFSMDAWVQDLETVVDDLGLAQFPLLGVSQGGAVAVAYAARHPDRVSRLVLFGAYVQGRLRRATSDEQRREAALQVEMVRLGWGREDPAFRRFFTSSFIPDAPTRAVGVLCQAAPANHVGGERGTTVGVVGRNRCVRGRDPRPGAHPGAARPRRTTRAVGGSATTGGADSGRTVRPARQSQPPSASG